MEQDQNEKLIFDAYLSRIQRNLYGLLCEYEKDGEWESFLDTILVRLNAVSDRLQSIKFLELMTGLNQLRFYRHKYFKRGIFDSISLMGRIRHDILQ